MSWRLGRVVLQIRRQCAIAGRYLVNWQFNQGGPAYQKKLHSSLRLRMNEHLQVAFRHKTLEGILRQGIKFLEHGFIDLLEIETRLSLHPFLEFRRNPF